MKWTESEIKVLEQNRHLTSNQITSILSNRTYESIVQKRNKLGLQWSQELKWEQWEIDLIKENQYLSTEEISKSILPHRSYEAVKTARNKSKLPQLVRCNKCGVQMIKNNQFDICSDCKKTTKDYNSTISHKYSQYMNGAKRRGYSWELTLEQFVSMYNSKCTYCGDKIDGIGIDRVDNTKGYIEENCVNCCKHCNQLKMAYEYDEWIAHMKKILKNLGEI
jgi:hypothetical protein